MSHPHNPDTRIVLAPQCWLVDIGERPLESRGFGSLLRREGIRCASRSVATPMPTGAMSSPQTSVARNFSRYLRFGVPILERGMRTEVYSGIDRRAKECYGKNVMEGQFLPGLKTGVSLPI